MNEEKLRRLVASALVTVIVCLATMAVRVPSPMGGYVNLGDCFVLMAGWALGPWWGAAAAAVGSAMADLFGGAAYFAPGTFVIKGLCAMCASLLARAILRKFRRTVRQEGRREKDRRNTTAARLATLLPSGLAAELVMTVGYFGYTSLLLGRGLAALASVPGNLLQGAVALIAGYLFTAALWQISDFRMQLDLLKEKETGKGDQNESER